MFACTQFAAAARCPSILDLLIRNCGSSMAAIAHRRQAPTRRALPSTSSPAARTSKPRRARRSSGRMAVEDRELGARTGGATGFIARAGAARSACWRQCLQVLLAWPALAGPPGWPLELQQAPPHTPASHERRQTQSELRDASVLTAHRPSPAGAACANNAGCSPVHALAAMPGAISLPGAAPGHWQPKARNVFASYMFLSF